MGATPRHRSRDTVIPLITAYTTTRCNGSSYDTQIDEWNDRSGAEKLGNGEIQETSDWVVPNFKARSAAGEIFNNPFRTSKTKHAAATSGSWDFYWIPTCTGTSTKAVGGNTTGGHSNPPASWGGHKEGLPSWYDQTGDLRILAGTSAWANVASPEVLGGEFLRDAHRTFEMLRHPLGTLREALTAVRTKKKFQHAGLSVGAYIGSEWLKYRYGLTPALNDIAGAFEAIVKPIFTDRKTARGYADYPLYEASDTLTGSLGAEYGYTTQRYCSQHQQVRAGILYRHVSGMNEKFGLHLNSIVPTLWEILPWSFVGDWFFNVGDYLSAVVPKAGTQILSSWTTVKVTHKQRSMMTSSPLTGWNLQINGGPGLIASTERVELTRTPGANLGVVARSNDLTLSRTKNWLHTADAFALIAQLLYSLPGKPVGGYVPRSRVRARPRNWSSTYDVYQRD